MTLLEGILSLGVLTSLSNERPPRYGFRYHGRTVNVCYTGCLGNKGLYHCACLGLEECMLVEGPVPTEIPSEADYLVAASNAFKELEMREPTSPFRLETLEVITVRGVCDVMKLQKHFLGNG